MYSDVDEGAIPMLQNIGLVGTFLTWNGIG
jgi:hypothetical protein